MAESRTKKSIKNSFVAVCFYAVNIILQFFSRKVFLDRLGTEILGLNTTASNLLEFLNLAELGIGSAVAFSLYKPLFNKDYDSINEIVSVQGWLYKKVAYVVILSSLILYSLFPIIFKKIELPLWYAYASFSVILFGTLLTYFVNYKQIIFSADQRDYKIQYSYKSIMLLKVLIQIFTIKYLSHGYEIWIITEVVFPIIASYSLNISIKRTYPYLKSLKISKEFIKTNYTYLVIKIKQLFIHKIGSFALTQSSPIIIYAYSNLTLVALYGNYMVLVIALNLLINAVFNSMGGGIGNLVASSDLQKILSVFRELFSIRFLIITTLCLGFYILSPAVVRLWIGEEYILPQETVLIIILTMYIGMSRSTVDNFIAAYGAFGDIYAPVVECVINIGLSIIFGYYWGLNGILLGVLTSQIIVIFLWKPFYLFKITMQTSVFEFISIYSKNILAFVIGISSCFLLIQYLSSHTKIERGIVGIIGITVYFFITMAGLIILKSGISDFIVRLKKLKS